MGWVSIDIDKLQQVLDRMEPAGNELYSAGNLVGQADAAASICFTSTIPGVPRIHLIVPNYGPYDDWQRRWRPRLREALDRAIEMRDAIPGFGPLPVFLPDDLGLNGNDNLMYSVDYGIGQDIGVKIATGQTLTDEEWAYLNKHRNDPNTAEGIFSASTPEQLAKFLGDHAYCAGPPPAGFKQHVQTLSSLFATWANQDGNHQKAADAIFNGLTGTGIARDAIQSTAAGMSLLISYAKINTETAVNAATRIYEWEQWPNISQPGVSLFNNEDSSGQFYHRPDGSVLIDADQGIMAMLANNPQAATKFFTSGGDPVPVTVKGVTYLVDPRIRWAIDRPWAEDNGNNAGHALFAASTPSKDPDGNTPTPTPQQVQVASQWLMVIAGDRCEDHDYQAQSGIASAAALMEAAYTVNVIKIINGQNVHGGLAVTTDILGLAIQSISHDTNNVAVMMDGWLAHLGEYLKSQQVGPVNERDILSFLDDPSGIDKGDPAYWLYQATVALDFISDNALAAWPTGKQETAAAAFWSTFAVGGAETTLGTTLTEDGALAFSVGILVFDSIAAAIAAQNAIKTENNRHEDETITETVANASNLIWIQTLIDMGYITHDNMDNWNISHPYDKHPYPELGDDTAAWGNDPTNRIADAGQDAIKNSGVGDLSNPVDKSKKSTDRTIHP